MTTPLAPMPPLLPTPAHMQRSEGLLHLPAAGVILIEAQPAQSILGAARLLQETLRTFCGRDWPLVAGDAGLGDAFAIGLNLTPGNTFHPEGYALTMTPSRVDAVASTPAGIFYAVQTLRQIAATAGAQWPLLRIDDAPALANRGVMLDISRNRVPTMATLYALVDLFAALKFNQLQLYTEHTFAYRNHPDVWAQASPMTGDEILALDGYCRARFIELVPNQNTFGHMRPWLTLPRYRDLAEAPDGCDTRWGHFDEPFSLNPTDPRSMDLVVDLLDELLPHFSSRQMNAGLDEPVDVGEGASRAAVAERGFDRVFFEYFMRVYREVKRRGRTLQFWGDIIMEQPQLVSELPRDVIALEWGYEANHPFAEHAARFAASGVPFYLCPGTSSWNSVAGRTDNALGNLRSAATAALQHGAVGYLVTDWGDNGHWQPLAVSLLLFAYGAGLAWRGGEEDAAAAEESVATALNAYLFGDESNRMAQCAASLGRVDQLLKMPVHNSAMLFQILQPAYNTLEGFMAEQGVDAPTLRARIVEAQARLFTLRATLDDLQPSLPEGVQSRSELVWAAEMLLHACYRGLWMLGGREAGEMPALAADADRLITTFDTQWHARHRHGGYADAHARLMAMRADYGA
jgi:hexosaminidase